MTPHILLLTSAAGTPFLIPIIAIEEISPRGDGAAVYTHRGGTFDVKESFDSIISCLGGLVMRPRKAPEWQ